MPCAPDDVPTPVADLWPVIEALADAGMAATFVGPDQVIRWWSTGCEELFGWRARQVVGHPFQIVPASTTESRLVDEGRWSGRISVRCADGSVRDVQVVAFPHHAEDGSVAGLWCWCCDVNAAEVAALLSSPLLRPHDAVLLCQPSESGMTVVVHASPAARALVGRDVVGMPLVDLGADGTVEVTLHAPSDTSSGTRVAVLREARSRRNVEERLRTAAELAGVGCWELDLRTREVAWDERTSELLGYGGSGTAPSWQAWLNALTPDDRAAAHGRAENVRRGDGLEEVLYRIRHRDGTVRRLLSRWRVAERDGDEPTRLMGILVDVTESQAAAERIQSTIEAMSEAYVAVDRDLRYTYVNGVAAGILGASPDELIGRTIWDIFPEGLGTEIEAAIPQIFEGETVQLEVCLQRVQKWVEVRGYPIDDGIAFHFRDVTERKVGEEELAYAASHDDLTGLPNRPALETWLNRALQAEHEDGHDVAVLFCDVDRFKFVNDSLGHAAGDDLLVAVAERLSRSVRPDDIVARYGGDEFVVGLRDATADEADAIAQRMLDALRQPIELAGQRFVVTTSVGIALAADGATTETLLRDADAALFRAKDAGRDQVACFDDHLRADVVARLQTANELREAIIGQQLRVHFQPGFDLHSGAMVGAEALLRWEHPTRGLLSAGAFIDHAEEAGLIGALGDWVVPATCATRHEHPEVFDRIVVWVNIAASQLTRPGFARHFLEQLATSGTDPFAIGVEVTESALADHDGAIDALATLRAAGVRIAIDDFGTGYSSIARLRHYPVDVLKLDRAFTADLHTPVGRGVVTAVIELAHAVGALTLAEGVETPDQLELLRSLGCDRASGFYLARPMAAAELTRASLRRLSVAAL